MTVAYERAVRVFAVAVLLVGASDTSVSAWDRWDDGSGGNCAGSACHGDFRDSPYTSNSDGSVWADGLHDEHRYGMLAGECDVCHASGPRSPVYLASSAGGPSLDPLGCVGCHGRAEDDVMSNPSVMSGFGGYGAGLRQHHDQAGVTTCRACHDDADPTLYTPVGEEVLPPYYTAPTATYPEMPQDSCNPLGTETRAGTDGLDNDGDGFYDGADTDCTAVMDAGVPDAGPPDAGPLDAGPSDAGTIVADAGPLDAGDELDAGPADPDAGVADAGSVDAGGEADAGAAPDAAPVVDAGVPPDGAVAPDAAVDGGAADDGGCSCSVPAAGGARPVPIVAALVGLWLWRRRSRR